MSSVFRRIRERYAAEHPIHIYHDADLEKKARGAYLVELDPTCEIQTEDWLERMLGNLQRTQKGEPASGLTEGKTREDRVITAVCAKIINENGQIVSCGLTDHEPGSPYPGSDRPVRVGDSRSLRECTSLLSGSQDPGYFARSIVQQTVCGTDRWCFMVRRSDIAEREAETQQTVDEACGTVILCPDVVLKQS